MGSLSYFVEWYLLQIQLCNFVQWPWLLCDVICYIIRGALVTILVAGGTETPLG